jgi:hypothetical protein
MRGGMAALILVALLWGVSGAMRRLLGKEGTAAGLKPSTRLKGEHARPRQPQKRFK